MKTLRILTSQDGDRAIEFDMTEATAAARAEAEALFKQLMDKGGSVFNVPSGDRVTSFENLGEESIAVPRIVGG